LIVRAFRGLRSSQPVGPDILNPNIHHALLFLLALCAALGFAQIPAEPLRPQWCRELPRPEYKTLERVSVPSDWFDVYRIRPGVFAIYEPHQFEEVISYLILGERVALLFDTGMGIASIRGVVVHLTKLPVTVLNSHTHFDHTGGNAEFTNVEGTEILNEDTAYTRENAKGQSNAYSCDALAPERICGALPAGVSPEAYAVRPWKISRYVHDSERIDLGGRELEILFTPGHTPDSLALLDRKNGLLFTGDTFYPGPVYLFAPETDFAAYARSVAKLAALEPQLRLLLPAHNVPVAEPLFLTRLQQAVKKVQQGTVRPTVTGNYREYRFQGFSLLLSAE
jgi:glyoxylase-like metal-dependent hydrolase (beta-lactamase superfamily II)